MRMTQSGRHDHAVETFANHSDMTEREAEAYVWREIRGVRRAEAAEQMDVSENTLDNQLQAARQKVSLPPISKIETHTFVSPEKLPAVVIWFANGAKLRYVEEEDGTVNEQTYRATDPDSVYESYDIGVDPEEMREAAFESVAEYINVYQDDVDAIRRDWPHVFEAIVLFGA